jgi:hypothetical protein
MERATPFNTQTMSIESETTSSSCSNSSSSQDDDSSVKKTNHNNNDGLSPHHDDRRFRRVTFDTSLNRYYKRIGQWLNKTELYYSHTQLKEMKAEALATAKSIEDASSSSSWEELRGYEGLAPNLLKTRMERRKRARDAVIQEQHKEESNMETLAELYRQASEEAVIIALEIANRDSQAVSEIRQEVDEQTKLEIQQQQQQQQQHSQHHQEPDKPFQVQSKVALPSSPTSVIALPDTAPATKTFLRVESSTFHSDNTFSASSSFCSDNLEEEDENLDESETMLKHSNHAPTTTTRRLKNAVSFFGRRLRRAAS